MSMFDRMDRRLTNMSTMMERLGVDPVDLSWRNQGQLLPSAIHACRACQNGELCREWLLQTPASKEPPAFCPNAELFAQAREFQTRLGLTSRLH